MLVDDAITSGAREYPRISIIVEWLQDPWDTLVSQSNLIRVASYARVELD